jgi:hypothetical protein
MAAAMGAAVETVVGETVAVAEAVAKAGVEGLVVAVVEMVVAEERTYVHASCECIYLLIVRIWAFPLGLQTALSARC